MVEKFMNEDDTNQLQLEQLLNEAISTLAIEGETLQRSSVRSSINKILKLGLEDLMEVFIVWLNSDNELGSIYKATIAHLYFVLIHPFDDGNGRIARAITDYVLANSSLANPKFYSISTIIYQKRKEYYSVLDKVCTQINQDISLWIQWFIKLLEESIDSTLVEIETVTVKAKFWDKYRETKLNDRQKKVILKMLFFLPEEFEGGMRVQKYMSITKTTRLTASRDLSDLLSKGIMLSHGKGRGVYYSLVL